MNTSSKKLSAGRRRDRRIQRHRAAIAKHLAAEGASLVVNYASSKIGADKIVAEITSAGEKLSRFKRTLRRKRTSSACSSRRRRRRRLDILVNNAGIYEFSPLEGITEEHFHKHSI